MARWSRDTRPDTPSMAGSTSSRIAFGRLAAPSPGRRIRPISAAGAVERVDDDRIRACESAPSGLLSGPDDRLREPEGRCRQDHDSRQPRQLPRRRRRSGSWSSTLIRRATPPAVSGVDRAALDVSVYDAVVDASSLAELIVGGSAAGVDVVPASIALAGAEVELAGARCARASRCDGLMERLLGGYDSILIDCPPSLGLLTVNALTAADAVLVPLQCEYYALEGSDPVALDHRSRAGPPQPAPGRLEGIVLTMADRGRSCPARSLQRRAGTWGTACSRR